MIIEAAASNVASLLPGEMIVSPSSDEKPLVGKEFFVGNVKLKAHDLCRPCKYLQDKLGQQNLVKELLYKGGLRCEILTDGEISVGDIIN